MAFRTFTRHFRHITTALLLLGLLPLGLAQPGQISAQDSGNARPMDLAAMVLNPLDLGSLGLTPYGIGTANYVDGDTASNVLAEFYLRPADDINTVIESAGYQRGYVGTNDNLDPPGSSLSGIVASGVIEFSSPENAESVYSSLTDWSARDEAVTIADDAVTIGDASQIVSFDSGGGEAPATSTTLITLRVGNYLGIGIVVAASPPDDITAIAGQLGSRLAEKIEIIRDNGAANLSYRAIGFSTQAPDSGMYIVGYGGNLRLTSETDESFASRSDQYGSVVDSYRQTSTISGGDDSTVMTVELNDFVSEDAAAAWLDGNEARLQSTEGIAADSPVLIEDIPNDLGDGSAGYSYTRADGRSGQQILIRTGISTLSISLETTNQLPIATLVDIATRQLACLGEDAICTPISVPQELNQTPPTPEVDEIPSTVASQSPEAIETPTVEASPTAVPTTPMTEGTVIPASPSPVSPVGQEYIDPTYPYSVTYDPAKWTIAEQGAANDRNFARFTNGTSLVFFIAGKAYGADVARCIQDAATSLSTEAGVTNAAPARDTEGNLLAGSGESGSYAVYTYTAGDGTPTVRYFACVVLVPDESTLLIMQIVPQVDYNDQVDDRTALLGGVRIDPQP